MVIQNFEFISDIYGTQNMYVRNIFWQK